MNSGLKQIVGLVNLLTALFFVLVSWFGLKEILFGASEHSLEGQVIGLIFCLAIVGFTGFAAWNLLYVEGRKERRQTQDEKLHQIVALARQHQGVLSALEVSLDLDLGVEESKKLLDLLVNKGLADMDITEHATIIFNFPDFKTAELMPEHAPLLQTERAAELDEKPKHFNSEPLDQNRKL